ncbi:alpha/beta hydrolase [Pontibacillus sp. ALD_SL1]|uniref:intracellular short-chain-length polyhydroxyalkanoate depolymerase n=1 Tax=Pontibacillus sp. ALD_SL1 TaxID=2777185 RepID=UPI001A970DBB|nr:alpha/beta hydrolase [Pontibacillus sp. ALD_SL1]QST00279.1 alpha/beta hydrolase [Pontibacillus sp. ALD_SL1]
MVVNVHMKKVQLQNGESLGYRERVGGDEVVLLLHGNMTSSKHWDLVLEKIDEKYKVYALDLRGFGTSTYLNPIGTIGDFAEDVKLFVDALGLSDFACVGWSTGGAVAMEFCARYPHYCNRLLLLASASTRGYPFFATGENGLPDPSKRLGTIEEIRRDPGKTIPIQQAYDEENVPLLRAIWKSLIYTHNQPNEELYQAYTEDMMTQRNLAEVYQSLNLFNISHHHNGLVEGNGSVDQIDIPVLVMRGERDLVITERMNEELLEDLGDRATYVPLPDCGHSPIIDNLDLLVQTMEQFLEEKERQRQ